MKKFPIAFLFSMGIVISVFSQSGNLFNDNRLSSVYITIHADSLAILYDSVLSDHYYLARFIYDDGNFRDTCENIGFRLRGNTSRYSQKKSFKISFNEYVQGRKYQGVKKINLNGEHNDPTMIREKLFYDLWKRAGMAERRTAFVKVFINQIYYGLYTILEEMDKDWLEHVFTNKNGNLYKCTYPANLVYLGTNQQTYKNLVNSTVTGGRVYELQTNEAQDNYARLVELITILNMPPDNVFSTRVSGILEVDHFLKALAMDVATGNWDDYSYNKNNFYLYDNPAGGKFEFITYDPDNTFGIDWFGIDWANRDCRKWVNENIQLPLAQKLLAVPDFFHRYKLFLDTLANTILQPVNIFPRIDSLKALIQQAAMDDTYRTLDYGYTIADFNNSYVMSLGDHTPWGLKPFLTKRRETTLNQLHPSGLHQSYASSGNIKLYPNPASDILHVLTVKGNSRPNNVKVIDVYGKTVSIHSFPDQKVMDIPVRHLNPGVYRLMIETPGGTSIVGPFVKF